MTVNGESTISQAARAAVPWITIATSVVAVCSFFILTGMWLGPQKDVPTQLSEVRSLLTQMQGRLDKNDWAIEALKNQANGLGMQLSVGAEDRNKLSDRIRDMEDVVQRLETSSVSRETFLEWKAALEQRNKNISAPPLNKEP